MENYLKKSLLKRKQDKMLVLTIAVIGFGIWGVKECFDFLGGSGKLSNLLFSLFWLAALSFVIRKEDRRLRNSLEQLFVLYPELDTEYLDLEELDYIDEEVKLVVFKSHLLSLETFQIINLEEYYQVYWTMRVPSGVSIVFIGRNGEKLGVDLPNGLNSVHNTVKILQPFFEYIEEVYKIECIETE